MLQVFRKRQQNSANPRTLLPHVRRLSEMLRTSTDEMLLDESNHLRSEIASGRRAADQEILVAGVALATEVLRRSQGIELYDVQLQAVLSLGAGRVVQMQTGEGKTFVAIAAACHLALAGRGVHVVTPNEYLAGRDCEAASQAMHLLQMKAGLLPEGGENRVKRAAYDCDVTYGTGHEFGFDYLRDQINLRRDADAPLGSRLHRRLCQPLADLRSTIQRGLAFAIVDEADSVLIDDAGSPLVLSEAAAGAAADEQAHLTARELAERLQESRHYTFDRRDWQVSLTDEGVNRCYAEDVAVPANVLLRPWTHYVEQALRAQLIFQRDVHYVVQDDEVKIVDATTGRIFEERSWQQGLHQAVEARERVPVTAQRQSLARISRQRFFRRYDHLCGLTGTATGCENEFRTVYGREVVVVPLNIPCARTVLPHRWFASIDARHAAIVDSVCAVHSDGRPVLVGTRSIEESKQLADLIETAGGAVQVLNGLQNDDEAHVVARAGQARMITIATNLAGRGTDIALTDEVRSQGGLHVIVAECQLSSRMDRQLVGRCGRQGDPGSAQSFVSAEDLLISRYGSWLGNAIRRDADAAGEAHDDYTSQLLRVQAAAEKQGFLNRCQLLRHDERHDVLLGQRRGS